MAALTARRPTGWPIAAAAVLLAAAWPLTASVVHPLALPGALGLFAGTVLSARRPEFGIAAILLLTPFVNAEIGGLGPLGFSARPLEPLFMIAIFALLAVSYVDRGERRLSTALPAALLALIAVSVLSALQGLDAGASVSSLVRLVEATALFLLTRRVCRTRIQVGVVLTGAVLALIVAAGHGLGQGLLGDAAFGFAAEGQDVVTRVHGAFLHPNHFGVFLAQLIPLAAVLALTAGMSRNLRALALAGVVLAVPALVLSYSRGAIAGLVVGGLAWLLVVRPRRVLPIIIGVAVLTLAVAPAALVSRFDEGRADTDIAERVTLWKSALSIAQERPLLGTGVGTFPEAYASLSSPESTAADRPLISLGDGEASVPFHAHNAYLTVLAEQGVLGIAAFGAFAALALFTAASAARSRDRLTAAIGVGAGAGLAAWGVNQLLNVGLYQEGALPLFALIALADALTSQARVTCDEAATATPAAIGEPPR
ncbi:MAG: O-antigen ligase family protein [Solirubrobacterales bacterium]|nr:O-antigen ligase family protein [Solirubrobacterales bacterium]